MLKRHLGQTRLFATLLACVLLLTIGCGDDTADSDTDPQGSANASNSDLMLSEPPEGAQPITALKESAEEGDEVVVNVIVGGTKPPPIVDGLAIATVVDASLFNRCVSADDHCETPWDYCCAAEDELNANKATIQLVDDDGRPMSRDFSGMFSALDTLTVVGTVAERPNDQVLTINATGIYVEPQTP